MGGDESLRKSRRKGKAGLHLLESPFPIPIESITGKTAQDSRWYYYFGSLQNDHVAVSRLGDLTFLYRLGFFGKGMLSRSRPQFEVYSDVLSEHSRKQYLWRFSKADPGQREMLMQRYKMVQQERLRQHEAWSMMKTKRSIEKESYESDTKNEQMYDTEDAKPLQCVDLHTDIDDGLFEEDSTDGENEEEELITQSPDLKNPGLEINSTKDDELGPETSKADFVEEIDSQTSRSLKRCGSEDDLNIEIRRRKYMKVDDPRPTIYDPYKLHECLRLTLEEAFFLSYGLGCLGVKEEIEAEQFTIEEMWNTFGSRKINFIEQYVAYHYYRSKGWVVRYGNMYGADFALYKDGMPFFHASYSVYVHLVDESEVATSQSPFSWRQLSSISRVNEKVAKEVLFCYVIRPTDMTTAEMASPSCIKRFKVVEVVLRRWILEKHRELKDVIR